VDRAAPQVRGARIVATELGSMTRLGKALSMARVTLKAMSAAEDPLRFVEDADKRKRIEAMIVERSLDVATARKMEPWLLLTLFALPLCEMMKVDREVVDDRVVTLAEARKIPVEALETVDEQIAALSSLDGAFVGRYLASLADRPTLIDDAFETMVRLYTQSRVAGALPALRHALKMEESEYELNRVFMKKLLGDRNIVMRDRSRPMLAKGRAFIAVGALHLSGADGLVELFRKDGYKVSKVW
ncbi:MAG: TraB/GumN family protein, partial [Methylobacteriaceae bacterium]|nr:TraB/GumN family protein [Methylobacteriaceae bacterium]